MTRKRDAPNPSEMLERLRKHLEVLGLSHTREHLETYLAWATHEQPGPSVLLDRVFGEQAAIKQERRYERRIQESRLPERKTLENFDWAFQPNLDRAVMTELAELNWVRRFEDLILTGKSGTGKSHLLMAFGVRACAQGISVRYARCVDLMDDLYAGLADGSYPARLKYWCAPALLILDDVGLGQIKKRDDEPTAAHTLYNVIDRRHAHASTALTSNIKLSAWGRYLGDSTVAAAILDRLAMRALRIDIDGPSYRQRVAKERADQRGTELPDDTMES
jgi:DNA replication protein DnaC